MSRPRRGLAVLTLAAVALGSLAAPGLAAAPDRVFVQRVPGAEQTLYYRPHVFYLSADGALVITGVRWRHYGGRTATAVGTAHTNDCLPACIGGTFSTHRTKIRLSGRKVCRSRGNREIYTRLSLHILGEIPENFGNGRETVSMRPVDINGDPLC